MHRGPLLAPLAVNCILALLVVVCYAVLTSGALLTTSTPNYFIAPRRSGVQQPLAAFHPHLRAFSPYRLGLIARTQQQQQQQQHQQRQRRTAGPSSYSSSSSHYKIAAAAAEEHDSHNAHKPTPTAFSSLLTRKVMAAKGGGAANGGNGKDASLWNLPNILTLMRVFAIPVLVGIFYWDHHAWRNLACTLLFVFAAMTDWLDGYLARRMNLSSPLGAFLDPVADKLMVATALVLMADRMRSPLVTISTAIIINREIGVSALREWMASMGQRDAVAVGWWGKVKTATQMVALSILLYVQPPFPTSLDPALGKRLLDAGVGLLAFSAFLTVTSAAGYVQAAWPALTGKAKK